MSYLSTIDKLYRLQESANAFLRKETPMFAVHGLGPWYGAILDLLDKEAAPVPIMTLVAALHRPKSTLTKATNLLEKAGYITKTQSEKDGRFIFVELTPEGRIALRRFQQAYAKLEEKLFQGTGPQQRDAIKKILAELEANLK